MKRFTLGWQYAKRSLAIVRRHGALTGLAAIGLAVGCTLAIGPVVLAVWAFGGERDVAGAVAAAVAFLAFYLGLTFSGVAIASAAAEVLDGRDAHVSTALSVAKGRLRPILSWCAIGTVVAIALATARRKGGRAGGVLAELGGETWSLVTFLAIPIIAVEGLDPISTMKRSASLFRQRWGEQMTGTGSINFIFVVFSLPALAVLLAGAAWIAVGDSRPVGLAIALVGLLGLAAITLAGRAASATFSAILYRYAIDGHVPAAIPQDDLASLAQPVKVPH